MSDLVQSVTQNGAVLISINRADQRNALTRAMVEQLGRAVAAAAAHPAARIIVLKGAGKDFCAGLDLDEFYGSAEASPADHEREARLLAELLGALVRSRRPTAALVQGRAMGIGATLAIACDVVVGSDTAVFGFPEVTFGFVPAFAAALVPRLTGVRVAFDLLATGRLVKGEEARRLGLVSRIVPEEGFDAVTGSMVRSLAAVAPEIMTAVRDGLRSMQDQPLERALELGADLNARARASEPFREAARQFFSMA